MPYVAVEDNVRLYYRDHGTGIPVILLHGWASSGEFFENLTHGLTDRYRFIFPDMRGHGRSEKPAGDYSILRHASDLLALMSRLGITDAYVGGHSTGGAVVLRALTLSSRKLARHALFIGVATPKWTAVAGYDIGIPKETVRQIITQLDRDWPGGLNALCRRITSAQLDECFVKWRYQVSMQATRHIIHTLHDLAEIDMRADLAELTGPLSVFHGTRDETVPFQVGEYVARNCKNGTIVPFEQSGHHP